MSEVNDFQFKVILRCEQEEFNPTRKQYCEYLVEMNGVERPLRDILKENIEQQSTIEEYKDFCLNLCKFIIQKGLVDEYREKYGKEYKIITKWWNDD